VVQAFFDRFPHLRPNDFYLASESYGGASMRLSNRTAAAMVDRAAHIGPFLIRP
jgi:carboxypeptidase C (cathepsin A)